MESDLQRNVYLGVVDPDPVIIYRLHPLLISTR